MAIRRIVKVDEDLQGVLRQKAHRVKKVTPAIQSLMDDMVETMHDAPGMGLAAPQVGVSLRVIVAQLPEDEDDPKPEPIYMLADPEIIRVSEEMEEGMEGCLSIPGYEGLVDRHLTVVVEGLNRAGRKQRIKAEGTLARIFQHEIDHLNGVLYTDRLASPDKLFRLRRVKDRIERVPVKVAV